MITSQENGTAQFLDLRFEWGFFEVKGEREILGVVFAYLMVADIAWFGNLSALP